jgi:hypothetical protein
MPVSQGSAEAGGVPSAADIQERAVALLRDHRQDEAAAILAACRMVLDVTNTVAGDQGGGPYSVEVELAATPATALCLRDARDARTQAVRTALREVLPSHIWIDGIVVTGSESDAAGEPVVSTPALSNAPPTSAPHASLDLPQAATPAQGELGINQAVSTQDLQEWNGLRFRSHSEVCIARALERAGALFFPNARGRLGTTAKRENREPDFLVCHQGKWGILEVDGEPFHPPSRTVQDHARDRLFKAHGVRVVEHYDAELCRSAPDTVVQEFLRLLHDA